VKWRVHGLKTILEIGHLKIFKVFVISKFLKMRGIKMNVNNRTLVKPSNPEANEGIPRPKKTKG